MTTESNSTTSNFNPKQNEKGIIRRTEREKDPKTAALDRCDDLIDWYQRHADKNRNGMSQSRLTAIILSGLVPVLVIIQMSLRANSIAWFAASVLIALFPAGSAIISGMNELFQYKENWIRCGEAAEELKSEKSKFLTRTTAPYERSLDEYQAISNFVEAVETITLRETGHWKSQSEQIRQLDELLKSMKSNNK